MNNGDKAAKDLFNKHQLLWDFTLKNKGGISGLFNEAIALEFIEKNLPKGRNLKVKRGAIIDGKRLSPQIDAIVYSGNAVGEAVDVAIVDKDNVKAVFEVKVWQDVSDNAINSLKNSYLERKNFLPSKAEYILFIFTMYGIKVSKKEVNKKLSEVSDKLAIVARKLPAEGTKAEGNYSCNYDNTVTKLIKYLGALK